MPRKSSTPLDPRGREIHFYAGHWTRLTEILSPRGIATGVFIRELVARKLRSIEERALNHAKKTPDVEVEI